MNEEQRVRDEFAREAMKTLILALGQRNNVVKVYDVVEQAYNFADVMMLIRAKGIEERRSTRGEPPLVMPATQGGGE